MQRCVTCGLTRPLADFAWKRRARGQRQRSCRSCHAAYRREHYEQNRSRYIAAARARRDQVYDERVRWLLDYFKDHPCVDCGEDDPVVLDFDHARGDKVFNVAGQIADRSWPTVLAEMKKCEVVCANCHRRRSAIRGRFRRTRL